MQIGNSSHGTKQTANTRTFITMNSFIDSGTQKIDKKFKLVIVNKQTLLPEKNMVGKQDKVNA